MTQSLTWTRGWLDQAFALPSPNFGARPDPDDIALIVMHSISLPPGRYGNHHVLALFSNRLDCSADPYFEALRGLRVSTHFFIRRGGAIWQLVECARRAWHAGRSNFRGRPNCNDFSVGIELEGLEGQPFDAAQYDAAAALCAALGSKYPITDITGHEQIAPGRKFDPGDQFKWGLLQQKLGWPAAMFPPLAENHGTHSPGTARSIRSALASSGKAG